MVQHTSGQSGDKTNKLRPDRAQHRMPDTEIAVCTHAYMHKGLQEGGSRIILQLRKMRLNKDKSRPSSTLTPHLQRVAAAQRFEVFGCARHISFEKFEDQLADDCACGIQG